MADQTIDYDALAKQHGAISSTPPQGGIDYDALAKQHGAIASTPPQQGPTDQRGTPYMQQPQGTAGERFGSNLWEKSIGGLIDMGKGVADLAVQGARAASGQIPIPGGPGAEMIQGMTLGHIEQAKKTAASAHKGLEAIKKGDVKGALNHYTEAFGHGLATAVPGIGPAAASVGEQLGGEQGQLDKYGNVVTPGKAPDIAGGLGGAAGLIGTAAAPEAVRAVGSRLPAEIPITPRMANTNPAEASAMEYMRSKGIPTDAGAETGNAFVRGAQKLADTSPVGSVVSQNALRARTAALRGHAAELVAGSTPDVSAETHYTNFRNAEADPANIRPVPTGVDEGGNFTTEDMPLPVKVSELKPALKPIFEEMQWMPMADRNASAGFQAIKKILEGPDFIPASQAEIGLGGIKKMAREGEGRNAGIAKYIVPQLQDLIDDSVSSIGGPKAIESLQSARIAAAKEVGADWLTDTFKKAQAEGGFNREAGLWADWQRLNDPQKRTMFTPQQISDLDNFFLGVKKLAENPNPSGSGVLANMLTQLTLAVTHPQIGIPVIAGGGLVSKFLHSPAGIKLLTEGISVKNPLAAARVAAKMRTLTGGEPPVPPETPPGLPPEEPPTGGGEGGPGSPPPGSPPPPPPPGAPPASGGGAVALQGGLERNAATVAANKQKLSGGGTAPRTGGVELKDFTVNRQGFADPAHLVVESTDAITPERIRSELFPQFGPDKLQISKLRQDPLMEAGRPGRQPFKLQFLGDDGRHISAPPGIEENLGLRAGEEYHGAGNTPAIDNPQNQYQYTTPEGIPVYKAPGEQNIPPGSSPGEPATPPGTTGRAALRGGIERNQAAIEANKAKLTGEPAAPGASETGGGLYDKLQQAGDAAKERLKKPWSGTQLYSLFPGDKAIDLATLTAAGTAKGVKTLANRAMADMGEWGAARIAGGFIKYPEWSKQMMADASEVSGHAAEFLRKNMRAVYKQAQSTLKDRQSETLTGKVTEIQKILEYAEAGKEGTYWYKHVKPILQPMFGPNTDLFLNILAATSPQTPVARNVMLALKAYNEYLTGEPFSTDFEAHLGNLKNAAAGKPLSGLKVGSFAPNLMGDFIKVTVDTWMAKAYGFKSKVSDPQYRFMDYAISQAAKAKGLQPAEMQAAIWTGIKKLEGDPRLTAAPFEEVVKQYLQENPEIKMQIDKALKSNQPAAQLRAKALAAKGQ